MKPRPLGVQRMSAGSVPSPPVHLPPLQGGHRESPLHRRAKGVRIGFYNQTVPIMMAVAAVADAVQGDHETPEGHALQRGQVEALLGVGEADRDPAPGQQVEELAAIDELRDQPMFHALRLQPRGEISRESGPLVADDRDGRGPRLVPRRRAIFRALERREVDAVWNCQYGTIHPAGGGDRVGDLLAYADSDRPLAEIPVELGALGGRDGHAGQD